MIDYAEYARLEESGLTLADIGFSRLIGAIGPDLASQLTAEEIHVLHYLAEDDYRMVDTLVGLLAKLVAHSDA